MSRPDLFAQCNCIFYIISGHFLVFLNSIAAFERLSPHLERQMLNNCSMSPQSVPPLTLLMLPHPRGDGIFLVLSEPASQRHHELQSCPTLMSRALWAKFPHSPIACYTGKGCGDTEIWERSTGVLGERNAITRERALPVVNQSTLMLLVVHIGQLLSFWLRMLGCPHPDCVSGQDRGMSPRTPHPHLHGSGTAGVSLGQPGLAGSGKRMVHVAQRHSSLQPATKSRLNAIIPRKDARPWGCSSQEHS